MRATTSLTDCITTTPQASSRSSLQPHIWSTYLVCTPYVNLHKLVQNMLYVLVGRQFRASRLFGGKNHPVRISHRNYLSIHCRYLYFGTPLQCFVPPHYTEIASYGWVCCIYCHVLHWKLIKLCEIEQCCGRIFQILSDKCAAAACSCIHYFV